MTVAFRNVEGSPAQPVDQWPYEALVAAIERGTLRDWLPLISAVRSSPWGVVARQVEEYLEYAAPYGVGRLLRQTIDRARRRREADERRFVAEHVSALVASSGRSRAEFAAAIGTSRSRLSTYCSGSVTPSASLVRRMEQAAEALSREPR